MVVPCPNSETPTAGHDSGFALLMSNHLWRVQLPFAEWGLPPSGLREQKTNGPMVRLVRWIAFLVQRAGNTKAFRLMAWIRRPAAILATSVCARAMGHKTAKLGADFGLAQPDGGTPQRLGIRNRCGSSAGSERLSSL